MSETESSFSRIALRIREGIAEMTFVDRGRPNVIDARCCVEIAEAAAQIAAAPGLKAVLLGAQGKVFCVGGDIQDFLANRDHLSDHVFGMASTIHRGVNALHDLAVPVIAAVNGMAAGGGFSLVCGADLVIASRSATFNSAYTKTGLTPDAGGTYFLPRIVGIRRAFDLLATNPTLTADEACRLGIVSRVVDDDAFETEVAKLVQKVREMPGDVLAALKGLLRTSLDSSLSAHLDAETAAIAAQTAKPEILNALVAFLGKKAGRSA